MKKIIVLSLLFLLFSASDVHAQITCTPLGGNPDTGIETAVGCIPFGDTNALTTFILRIAIGIGGGIAFILMVFAAFMIMTSSGDPKRLNSGKELLISALSGLLLLTFSVFILRVLGVDILRIPGF